MSLPGPRTIALHRTGTIKVRVAGDTHCGAESALQDAEYKDGKLVLGTVSVRYTATLVAGADGLDENGFLVDQERLHQVMTDIGADPVPWTEPCELLALKWGRRLLVWLSVENTRLTIHSFDLTLSPAPNAGAFTAHFDSIVASAAIGLDRPLRLVA